MLARLLSAGCAAFLLIVTGCGESGDIKPGKEVEVTGTVTVGGAKLPAGVSITFQPTAGTALPATFPIKPDGTFSGKMLAAKYTYYLSVPEGNAKLEASLKGVPEAARKATLDRQIDISGGPVEIKF